MSMLKRNYKAIGAGVGAAIAEAILFGLSFIPGVESLVTPEVSAAFIVIVSAVVTWLFPANEVVLFAEVDKG